MSVPTLIDSAHEGAVHSEALYTEVQHFYGRQMRFMDSGDARSWSETFTLDGVFAANARPVPQSGRQAIYEGAKAASEQLEANGIRRRHWLGMLEVQEEADGSVTAKTYALIVSTKLGGSPQTELSCTCEDRLVRQDGQLLVQHRQVHRDDLPR